jgi:hypothetical protein
MLFTKRFCAGKKAQESNIGTTVTTLLHRPPTLKPRYFMDVENVDPLASRQNRGTVLQCNDHLRHFAVIRASTRACIAVLLRRKLEGREASRHPPMSRPYGLDIN